MIFDRFFIPFLSKYDRFHKLLILSSLSAVSSNRARTKNVPSPSSKMGVSGGLDLVSQAARMTVLVRGFELQTQ